MAMVSEFVAAVNMICSERGINPEDVYSALEAAVLAAYKKEYIKESEVENDNIAVELDRENGIFRIVAKKTVVKKVSNKELEISLAEAKKIQKSLREGDVVELEQNVEEFGRIAAQTAKQVVMQKIREFEKDAILAEYSGKVGEVFNALMQRMQGGEAVFEIGKAVAYMPHDAQIPNEFYRIGERYKVLLKAIEDTPRGKTLIVTRSAPEFLMELFKIEVPEIESGVVEIKACAREAGSRSKIAVVSHQDGVDPIGSCVGQKGMRIANVMSELGMEKIDVIEWREDIEEFVEKALSPAQVLSVKVKDGVATVKVEDDQLSLAIGKDGQNVRLAAKLTGLKIDIQGDGSSAKAATPTGDDSVAGGASVQSDDATTPTDDQNADDPKSATAVLSEELLTKLQTAGKSVEDIKGWSIEQLMELEGMDEESAKKIVEALA